MLDDIDISKLTILEICEHLKKSCCPALKQIIKQVNAK
jgi:hypothetical protein